MVFDRIAAPKTFEPEETPAAVRAMIRVSIVERSDETSTFGWRFGEMLELADISWLVVYTAIGLTGRLQQVRARVRSYTLRCKPSGYPVPVTAANSDRIEIRLG